MQAVGDVGSAAVSSAPTLLFQGGVWLELAEFSIA